MGRSFNSGISAEAAARALMDPRNAQRKKQEPSHDLPPLPVCILRAQIPLEPVSANELYANVPGKGRVLTAKGKAFKKNMAQALLTAQVSPPFTARPMALVLHMAGHWENRDGSPRKRDVSGTIKATEDALSAFMGVDDCWFYEVHIRKQHAAQPLITVQVFTVPEVHP